VVVSAASVYQMHTSTSEIVCSTNLGMYEGWLSLTRARSFEVEGPRETPPRSEPTALQKKRIRYVKINLKSPVADSQDH
jgi:hypothetical protein